MEVRRSIRRTRATVGNGAINTAPPPPPSRTKPRLTGRLPSGGPVRSVTTLVPTPTRWAETRVRAAHTLDPSP